MTYFCKIWKSWIIFSKLWYLLVVKVVKFGRVLLHKTWVFLSFLFFCFPRYLLTASLDQTTRCHAIWKEDASNVQDWHEIARPQVHGYDLCCLTTLPGHRFASGAEEKIVRVFEATKMFLKNYEGKEIKSDTVEEMSKIWSRMTEDLDGFDFEGVKFVEPRIRAGQWVQECAKMSKDWPRMSKICTDFS